MQKVVSRESLTEEAMIVSEQMKFSLKLPGYHRLQIAQMADESEELTITI